MFHQRAQHGRLIAAAGSDLQNLIRFLWLQCFGHQRDDERAADGLRTANGQRHIKISARTLALGHKFMSHRIANRIQDAFVCYACRFDPFTHQPIAVFRKRVFGIQVFRQNQKRQNSRSQPS